MKRTCVLIVVLIVAFIGSFLPLANAGEKLTKEETRQVITGNTVEEVCLERKKRKCWYLEAAEEGVYHVIGRKSGQHKKTWRLVSGNPYKL